MKKAPILFLSMFFVAWQLSSCQKHNSPLHSIVGTWKMTGFSGSMTGLGTVQNSSYNYSYDNASKILSVIHSTSGYSFADTGKYLINSEIWTFNADSTYVINESYSVGPTPTTFTHADKWRYYSNSKLNNGFILNGNPRFLISQFMITDAFDIKTLEDNNTLIIMNKYTAQSATDSTLIILDVSAVFSRQ